MSELEAGRGQGQKRGGTTWDTHLIFEVRGTLYGLDALAVREVLPRPRLSSLAGTAGAFIGMVNLRGSAIPVLDVSARLGGPSQPPRAADHLIIVEYEGRRTALLVGEIHEVRVFASTDIEAVPDQAFAGFRGGNGANGVARNGSGSNGSAGYGEAGRNGAGHNGASANGASALESSNGHSMPEAGTPEAGWLSGVTRLNGELVQLLRVPELLRQSPETALSPTTWPEAADEDGADAQILRERAVLLGRSAADVEEDGAEPTISTLLATEEGGEGVAIVTLGGETFGIGLDTVREFCRVGAVTPVPCCPPHIVGQLNLRGDMLTLLDLRAPLGLAAPEHSDMAVVVQVGELRAAVVVEDVRVVAHLRAEELLAAGIEAGAAGSGLRGTLPWEDKSLSLLDLSHFLTRPDLVVQEEV